MTLGRMGLRHRRRDLWKWRLKSNYPILSGMTLTAGGVVFFGDIGGNFYTLDAANGLVEFCTRAVDEFGEDVGQINLWVDAVKLRSISG
jgi:hypothetical protein